MNIDMFKNLVPISKNLFFSRSDPNDIRFGDIAFSDLNKYQDANVAVIACPQDIGVKRNKGRAGAQFAPSEIRKALYRYPVSKSHEYLQIIDLGNVKSDGTLEYIHGRLYDIIVQLLKDDKRIVVLGGGNDISYPDCRALSDISKDPLVFNIDRHLDVRADEIRNSGTPYRQLLEEGCIEPHMFHEVAINSFANSQKYIDYVEQKGAHIHYLGDIREKGIKSTIKSIVNSSEADSIFWGFDLDVVRASDAPGVSDPSPMGLTARQVCEIADVAATDSRTRIIEITEVNPKYDMDGITSKLAANIVVRALAKDGA